MTTDKTTDNPWSHVMNVAARILAESASVSLVTAHENLEIPPDAKLGDIATTISFRLAKQRKENPAKIAAEISKKLDSAVKEEPLIDRVDTKGPYINLFLSRGHLADVVIRTVERSDENYGKSDEFQGNRALMEYPAVNPSKPWHIGHTRNAVLGDTLGNVLEAAGYDVIRTDYINNLGLQIAQLVWKLMKDKPSPRDEKYDHFLGHLYVGVHEAFEKDKKVEGEIRAVARDLESLESEAARVSEEMVTECVRAQCQTAYRLGIFHDYQIWESAIAHSGLLDQARKMMLETENIFIPESGEKAGCVVADLRTIEEFKDMKDPLKVLFRSDGTRTYTGADVATQMWKFGIIEDPFLYKEFEYQPNGETVYRTAVDGTERDLGTVDLVFNIIGSEQSQPQRLVYTVLRLLGYNDQSSNSHHIAYEFVGLEDEDFSGREGTWIGYSCDEVLDKAEALARKEVEKRNPEESEDFKNDVAAKVGTGSVRYLLLKSSPDRKITFRWDDALDFNGDAAPYLQYSIARAQRILERADEVDASKADPKLLVEEAEFALVKAISRFPDMILEVVRSLKKETWGTGFSSNRIAAYCYELATLFSRFYDSCPVLKAEPDFRNARLELVKAFKTTMVNCLGILGIPVVERM
ncbi:MAG: arginine--tRNA ligase [Candidatus Thorarchaeota archaeon]